MMPTSRFSISKFTPTTCRWKPRSKRWMVSVARIPPIGRKAVARRAVPRGWNSVSHDGSVLATSDFEQRDVYLSHVGQHRSPRLASHWQALLMPLTIACRRAGHAPTSLQTDRGRPHPSDDLPRTRRSASAEPRRFRAHGIRHAAGTIGYAALWNAIPGGLSKRASCYDRYWDQAESEAWTGARYLCTGAMFTVVGSHHDAQFIDRDTGILGQFRHQLFLLGLIAHFHKAALLVMSDHLSAAVNRLDPTAPTRSVYSSERCGTSRRCSCASITDTGSMRSPTNCMRATCISCGLPIWATTALFSEVRQEVNDINQYLDSARAKKLADIGVRLGVVATLRLRRRIRDRIFGHERVCLWRRFSRDENGGVDRRASFSRPRLRSTRSAFRRRSPNFLDALSSERLTWRQKYDALLAVWRKPSI